VVEGGAESVDVGALVDIVLAAGLLGAHVVRRAEGQTGAGEATVRQVGFTCVRTEAGEAEITELGVERLARAGWRRPEQDVRRFDVAVQHAVAPGRVKRLGHLPQQHGGMSGIELALFHQPGLQTRPVDQFHEDVARTQALAGTEHADDVGVGQALHRARLAQEAAHVLLALGQLSGEELHRRLAPIGVAGTEDVAHATAAEPALDDEPLDLESADRR